MAPSVDPAARALVAGGLVVCPTDTLLGLFAAARDAPAVGRLQRLKGRPSGQALAIAVSSLEEVDAYARLSRAGRRFVRRHLPGPFTVLARPSARARHAFPAVVAGGRTIGVRVPDHPLPRALAHRAGPVVATSTNVHGSPPARSIAEARRTFGRSVAVYMPARPAPSGTPSMLVDLTGPRPRTVTRR